jgi:hypothetical protein
MLLPGTLLYSTEDAMIRKSIELIHEGRYAAEVPVDLIEDDTGWSPYLSLEDASSMPSGWHCAAVRSPKRQSTAACLN